MGVLRNFKQCLALWIKQLIQPRILYVKGGIIIHYYGLDFKRPQEFKESQLEEKIEEAKEEWQEAREYFDLVSDPELVDYAIYLLGAAERKYQYLLKMKQQKMK